MEESFPVCPGPAVRYPGKTNKAIHRQGGLIICGQSEALPYEPSHYPGHITDFCRLSLLSLDAVVSRLLPPCRHPALFMECPITCPSAKLLSKAVTPRRRVRPMPNI